jgi:hypothetical protein
MTEATWGNDQKTQEIDWRMSVALENVPRGDVDVAEVTSLESAVRAWIALDADHRSAAAPQCLRRSGPCRSTAHLWRRSPVAASPH